MFTRRTIAASILAACLSQACTGLDAKRSMVIVPITKVSNSVERNGATFYELGKYYQARGNLDLAASSYLQALTLLKDHVEVRNALASVFSQQGKLEEAESILRSLIAEQPNIAHLYNNLGFVNYLQGNYEAAAFALDTALTFDPSNERARNNWQMVQVAIANNHENESNLLPLSQLPKNTTSKTISVDAEQYIASNASTTTPMHTTSEVAQTAEQLALADKGGIFIERALVARTELVELMPSVYALKSKMAAAPIQAIASTGAALAVDRKTFRLEIANGNGVAGMARQLSRVLTRKGFVTAQLTNERPFRETLTRIQYRHGFHSQAAMLKDALRVQATIIEENNVVRRADVRVVLGKDAVTNVTEIERRKTVGSLALNEQE